VIADVQILATNNKLLSSYSGGTVFFSVIATLSRKTWLLAYLVPVWQSTRLRDTYRNFPEKYTLACKTKVFH